MRLYIPPAHLEKRYKSRFSSRQQRESTGIVKFSLPPPCLGPPSALPRAVNGWVRGFGFLGAGLCADANQSGGQISFAFFCRGRNSAKNPSTGRGSALRDFAGPRNRVNLEVAQKPRDGCAARSKPKSSLSACRPYRCRQFHSYHSFGNFGI